MVRAGFENLAPQSFSRCCIWSAAFSNHICYFFLASQHINVRSFFMFSPFLYVLVGLPNPLSPGFPAPEEDGSARPGVGHRQELALAGICCQHLASRALGKRRGLSPAPAARHSQSTRVHTTYFKPGRARMSAGTSIRQRDGRASAKSESLRLPNPGKCQNLTSDRSCCLQTLVTADP